jgi:NitT/TauT family transport system substrate-binding protein
MIESTNTASRVRTASLRLAAVFAFLLLGSRLAQADVTEVRVAQQFGISYLPFHVMKHENLIEKEAAKLGLPNLKVVWTNLGSGSAMNEALLSGSIDFVSAGIPPFITLWAKTRGNVNVRGVATLGSMPVYLVSNNPNVKSLKDLSAKDRIGLPAPRVGYQAVLLQMAAEQALGAGKQEAFDDLTVGMTHPDAYAALVSGKSEITGHFGGSPYQELELAQPGTHLLVNSFDVLGGPSSFNIIYAKSAFHDENPKVYAAFLAALHRAMDLINSAPDDAVRIYLAEDDMKLDAAFVRTLITRHDAVYTTTPMNAMKYYSFMARTGLIKAKAETWKDLFFPEIYAEAGS